MRRVWRVQSVRRQMWRVRRMQSLRGEELWRLRRVRCLWRMQSLRGQGLWRLRRM